jgi:hypothetical protein
VGLEISTFLGQMALAALVAISVPKKVSILGPTPYSGLVMDIDHLKIITYHAIKTTGTVIVIIDMRYSQSCGYFFNPASRTVAPLTFSLGFISTPPLPCVNKNTVYT